MAFTPKTLAPSSIGAGSDAPNILTYSTSADTKILVAAADYFLPSYDSLKANDVVVAVCSTGLMILRVLVSSSTTVTTELLETTTA